MSYTPPKNLKLSGDVTTATPTSGDNDTSLATTAFVLDATGNASSNRPVFVGSGTNGAVANNTYTAISMTESTDTDSMHSDSTNPSRVYATSAGSYVVTMKVAWGNSATNNRVLGLYKNGAPIGGSSPIVYDRPGSDGWHEQHATKIVPMNAGDYIELVVWQNSGGALSASCFMEMAWVGGTGAAWGNAVGRARRTTTQSLPHGSWQDVTFTTVDQSQGVTAAASTVPLTIVTPGTYCVECSVEFAATSATGGRSMKLIHKNSAGTQLAVYVSEAPADSFSRSAATISKNLTMATGDFIQIQVMQTSGAALNLGTTDGTYVADVSAVRVGYQTNPSNFVDKTLLDAKGDLIGASAADTPVRIAAAASNGCVLTSDTSQTGGVKWQAPEPLLVCRGSGILNGTGAGDFWIPASGNMAWTGNGLQGGNAIHFKRSELQRYKGGSSLSLRLTLDVITNGTAYGGNISVRLWEDTGSGGGGAGAITVGSGATRMTSSSVAMPGASTVSKNHVSVTTTLDATNFPNDDGLYWIYVTTSGAGPAAATFMGIATLELV